VLERDKFVPRHEQRIHASDEFFQAISKGWSESLRTAFNALPPYALGEDRQKD
jgi:putative proteasome-type protease